jgi:hypothetical protein
MYPKFDEKSKRHTPKKKHMAMGTFIYDVQRTGQTLIID